tara:strand:- start:1197 stop:1403 length:207 start_codon:yes stop_codon:yes gene_type:complete
MARLHNVGFTSAQIEVLAELVSDAVAYLPDPEDQPEPGSFAAVIQKLDGQMQALKRLYCVTNYCDADS